MGVINYITALFTSRSLLNLPVQIGDEINLKRGAALFRLPIYEALGKTYEDVAYSATINLPIKGTYKNISASAAFTVNAVGATKGDDYIFTVKKTVAGAINLTFGTGFTGAAITALKGVNYSSGNVVSLAAVDANKIYTVTMHFQTEGVIIAVDENRSTDSGLI